MGSAALGLAGTGVFPPVLGGLIKYAGMVELVAGYDPESVTDDEALANVVGSNVLAIGVLGIVCGVVGAADPAVSTVSWLVFTVGTIVFAARAIRGARRYDTRPSN
ncbi:DUF3784 domain-containing protein [Halovivax cerinus]|uniref:DUF3784 domain-containing protein n=1 Tax=Halovivax cerinus TaxID=1487865 RepID=A0ABD5NMV7_9EURY|nr:DUF3784 domain-containing protein [Halovivax cerinus]